MLQYAGDNADSYGRVRPHFGRFDRGLQRSLLDLDTQGGEKLSASGPQPGRFPQTDGKGAE